MCIHPVPPSQGSGLPLKSLAQRGKWQYRSFHHQPQPQRIHLTGASWWRGTLGVPLPWPTAGGLPWRRDAPIWSGRGRWFLVEINAQTLPQEQLWMGHVAGQPGQHSDLVAGTVHCPQRKRCERIARKVQATFELPKRRSHAMSISNDYSAPPTPHALGRNQFLLIRGMHFGGKDYRLEQPEKSLAYIKVLQYWAETAQLPCLDKPH